LAQKIARTLTPIPTFFDTKPALLLNKVEEDNLPQELLGKIYGGDSFEGKFCFSGQHLFAQWHTTPPA
jgi:hypothetical protein